MLRNKITKYMANGFIKNYKKYCKINNMECIVEYWDTGFGIDTIDSSGNICCSEFVYAKKTSKDTLEHVREIRYAIKSFYEAEAEKNEIKELYSELHSISNMISILNTEDAFKVDEYYNSLLEKRAKLIEKIKCRECEYNSITGNCYCDIYGRCDK